MTKSNGEFGEFRGTTKQALHDIRGDIRDIKKGMAKSDDKMDKRLGALEKWRWGLTGGIVVLALTNAPKLKEAVETLAYIF